MPQYKNEEIGFEYPREWEDRTVIAFSAPQRPNATTTTNVLVTRDKLGDEEDVKKYADRQLVEMAKRLDAFQLYERKDIRVDGEPAIDLKFSWRGSGGTLI